VGAQLKVDPERLRAGVIELVSAGLVENVESTPGRHKLVVTATGRYVIEKLTIARRQSLTELLEGWDPESHPEVVELIRNLAGALLADDDKLLAEVKAAATV
jgi:DNA-binding MarR family transcriptional regulator